MAVYTTVTLDEMKTLLEPFTLGRLVSVEEVSAGIENTTYFVRLTGLDEPQHIVEYVLTIAESVTDKDMQFVSNITSTLRNERVPVAAPVVDCNGRSLIKVRGKSALLMPKMPGYHPIRPTMQQCRAIGTALAQLHAVTRHLELAHESHRSLSWVIGTGQQLLERLSELDHSLLNEALEDATSLMSAHKKLPQAIIHGDLFRDNTLYIKNKLTAIIDFFSAGTGFLLFDLAVAANDWCMEGWAFHSKRLTSLLSGYDAIRPLTEDEKCYWPKMLEIAALRFWVSRLASAHAASDSSTVKNPNLYRNILIAHKHNPKTWPL
jgi:homoserine kinase type II